jgi:hypothetical protein
VRQLRRNKANNQPQLDLDREAALAVLMEKEFSE